MMKEIKKKLCQTVQLQESIKFFNKRPNTKKTYEIKLPDNLRIPLQTTKDFSEISSRAYHLVILHRGIYKGKRITK